MKKYLFPALLMAIIFLTVFSLPFFLSGKNELFASDREAGSEKWVKLAEHRIDLSSNSDVIPVSGDNHYSAIKIKTRKGGINLHKCEVYFDKGEKTAIETRNDISPGAESRIIILPPGKGSLAKVVVWYDTINYPNQKPEIEIWGRNP